MTRIILTPEFILITGIMLIMPQHTHAAVQAGEINQLNLNREPLDVAASSFIAQNKGGKR